ncbi:TIMELESS-interacting protein [Tupaia chinensis]|uniref:TIMELESS-interacting protein n=1 Tax=Tupaia chinensis TaxID=246437 RepID=L9KI26_TUPCH|nr:TIMELESS-interacting protein [Tupaia chinensis]
MLEPRENGSDDLPDYEHIDDETFPPFPPPERGAAEGADADEDEVGESNDHDDVAATELDPFLTTSSESVKFASESSRSLTEEQQQRIERNKQLALERRQAKLLSNSQSQGNDTFMSTEVETVEEVNPGKDLKDSGGLNEDILDSSHDDVPADTVGEEEFRVEETARGQAC